MKSYELIHQLLNLVETFEKDTEREITLPDFAGFLLNHIDDKKSDANNFELRFGEKEQAAQELAFKIENNISRLILFMSRYAKFYIKKALVDTPLQTPEDFTCLAILLTHDHLSKTELISYNIQEKTSGSVVINRLIKAGLIREWDNVDDRRGKRISITDEGKVLLYRVFEHTSHVGKIVTGKLTLKEKMMLQYLLQKLEDFHHPVHENKLISSKDDLRVLAQTL